jgi:hypothetical protein
MAKKGHKMAKIYMELNDSFEQSQAQILENVRKQEEILKEMQGKGQEPQPAQSQSQEWEEEEQGFGLSMDELFAKGSKELAEEAGEELALGAVKETLGKFVDVSIEGGIATITMPAMLLEMFAEIFQGLEKGAER